MDPENSQALQLLQVKYIFLFNAFNLPNIFTSVNIKRKCISKLDRFVKKQIFFQVPNCQAKFNLLARAGNPGQEDACAKDLSAECLNRNSLTR